VIGNEVILTVIASRPSQPVISRTGQQMSTVAPLQQTRLKITLGRGADNKWRFCTITAPDAPDTDSPIPLCSQSSLYNSDRLTPPDHTEPNIVSCTNFDGP
jgi:hypothetical protein